MDSTCIEKNTVSGIRLMGQKYQAKLVLEPVKLLGAWRHCLHASADSRTGNEGTPNYVQYSFFVEDGRYLSKPTSILLYAAEGPRNLV